MKDLLRITALPAAALMLLLPASSQAQYVQGNLISDVQGAAQVYDPNLGNAWGIAFSAASPVWISDNATGLATVYRVKADPANSRHDIVTTLGLVVTVPSAGGGPGGSPTGQIFGFGGENFVFDTEDGTISGWHGGTIAGIHVNMSSSGAVFKGLTVAANQLYATDFHNGTVDVFDQSFNPVSLPAGAFTDNTLPSGYAPYNIQNIGGKLYVTFAQQDADKHDGNSGPGLGFVDVFDSNGALLQRLQAGSWFNQPWGVTLAPSTFGAFAGDLLVGNFGNGWINAFDPTTGDFVGSMTDAFGNPIAIDGLWALTFGNGVNGGDTKKLYFSAGPDDETHGLFGNLQPTPEPGAFALILGSCTMAGLLARRRSSKK